MRRASLRRARAARCARAAALRRRAPASAGAASRARPRRAADGACARSTACSRRCARSAIPKLVAGVPGEGRLVRGARLPGVVLPDLPPRARRTAGGRRRRADGAPADGTKVRFKTRGHGAARRASRPSTAERAPTAAAARGAGAHRLRRHASVARGQRARAGRRARRSRSTSARSVQGGRRRSP